MVTQICSLGEFVRYTLINKNELLQPTPKYPTQMSMSLPNKGFNQRYKEWLAQPSDRPKIYFQASSWCKDSQGLYDYHAKTKNLTFERHLIECNCKIYRHSLSGKVSIIKDENRLHTELQYIYVASIVYDPQTRQYRIQSADVSGVQPHHFIIQQQPDLFRNSYIVLCNFYKDRIQEGYPLQVGNYVRLGKVQFTVIEIKDSQGSRILKETSYVQSKNVYCVDDNAVKGSCKICLQSQGTPNDPLINPCKCKGSCGVVHLECLRSWTNSKIKKEAGDLALSYNFSKFECEICKALLPHAVKLADRNKVNLLDYQKPNKPYLILQSVIDTKQEFKERFVHILYPNECSSVKLGRGHKSSIKIDDITVSRQHAQVLFINNKFYLVDNKSKFGTLVKFRQQLVLRQKISIQSGRTLLQFTLSRGQNNTIWKSCGRVSKTSDQYQG